MSDKKDTSHDNKMSTQDIVKHCDELKEFDMPWEKVYAVLHKSLESNEYRILRSGNTLFWIHILEPNKAQMFIFNADTPRNFIRNFRDFAHAIQKAGYTSVFGITENPKIFDILGKEGFDVQVEDAGVDQNGNQQYKGTWNV